MMSQEQNDLITRTGAKDPCGKLMRMYWQPAALVDELQGPRPIRAVKLLGEDLVLFRNEEGRYGLIGRHRSLARFLPASLLRGRGYLWRLRQAVSRRLGWVRHADDKNPARIRPPHYQCRAHRIWFAADCAARDRRRAHPCARHQSIVPACLRHPDEHGDDDHAVARAC